MYRPIPSPGWTLGWTWAKREVIWSMAGAEAINQGDCSDFKTNIPHSCERSPAIIDLLPGRVPENQRFPGCCKGGVLGSHGLDKVAAFQVRVGHSGTSRKTVRVPKRFYLLGPGASYACGSAIVVPPSVFLSDNGRRKNRAMSPLAFQGELPEVLACEGHHQQSQLLDELLSLKSCYSTSKSQTMSFVFSTSLTSHSLNDSGVLYGNELLMGARNGGNVHSEMILGKDEKEFRLDEGWGFPRKVYFNGDECLMPSPDSYPFLPKPPSLIQPSLFAAALLFILLAFSSFWCGYKITTQKTKTKAPLLT
ncbi:hypothetical protein V6N12_041785 [Hibiscus sabdariffa]|uniref:COBRA C-terminal domain-containing protein n=1 Tax=Hibiscus sabdariffa TaxID=183260 RepID=A0ABR2AYE9_9ROSI